MLTNFLGGIELEGIIRNILFRDVHFSSDNLIVYKLIKYNTETQQLSGWKNNVQGLKPGIVINNYIEVINMDNILNTWIKNARDFNSNSITRLKKILQKIPQNKVIRFAVVKLIHELENLDANEVILPFGQYSGNILNHNIRLNEIGKTLSYIMDDNNITYLFGYVKLTLSPS